MKILYLTKGDHIDYQDDCLFLGLRELFGSSVVDYNKRSHNYVSYDEEAAKKLYGMGMTVTRILPDIEVDRTDITSKIKNKYYDLIVYGSIWRCNDYIDKILEYYPANRVIVVDGEDEQSIHKVVNLGVLYFKRELAFEWPRIHPISFAIPTSKVNFNKNKIKDLSYVTPLDKQTYIYKNEKDYYKDYNDARFGVTLKKAGWDCMRHYEILGNGCIPYFLNLDQCPVFTMTTFPKKLCIKVVDELKNNSPEKTYNKLIGKFKTHVLKNNTTKALANYFINTISSYEA